MRKLEFLAFQVGIYSKIVEHDAASSANTFGRGKPLFMLT